ncbi:hypothetical protein [Winogradskyella luteola]|uniref:Uncharacterized protein n=1 Tax=Winogradskyella luteola TaxID=2828330 RepID=A0A9X1JQP2_9FLAO|nr:hypothetical protein [Winogradskyella luteola]MBV7269108.1 hypothetical protein [Winogradskyella luteola]
MRYSKEEIIEKAKTTMDQIGWNYNREKEITAIYEPKEKEIEEARKYINDEKILEKYIENLRNFWTIGFDFEPESEIEYNSMFLEIDDDSGEPYRISHKQATMNVLINEDGKYYLDTHTSS